jgi:hypothetical protein
MQKSWRSRYVSRLSKSVSRPDDAPQRLFPYISVDAARTPSSETPPPEQAKRSMRIWIPLAASGTPTARTRQFDARNRESIEKMQERVKIISKSYNTLADALEKANATARPRSSAPGDKPT